MMKKAIPQRLLRKLGPCRGFCVAFSVFSAVAVLPAMGATLTLGTESSLSLGNISPKIKLGRLTASGQSGSTFAATVLHASGYSPTGATLSLGSGVIKSGTGLLVLSGATISNRLTIDSGTLPILGGGYLGSTIVGAGSLTFSGSSVTGATTLLGGATLGVNPGSLFPPGQLVLSGGGTILLTSDMALASPTLTSVVIKDGSLVFSGEISPTSRTGQLKAALQGLSMPPPSGMMYVVSMTNFKVATVTLNTPIDTALASLQDSPIGSAVTELSSSGFTKEGAGTLQLSGSNLVTSIPEPSSALLAALGMGLFGLRRRR